MVIRQRTMIGDAMKRMLVLGMGLVMLMGMAPGFAQEKPAAPAAPTDKTILNNRSYWRQFYALDGAGG